MRIHFEDSDKDNSGVFTGVVSVATFGSEQYAWHEDGAASYPDPDGPLLKTTISGAGAQAEYDLPKASVTVIRGKVNWTKRESIR